MIPPDLHRSGSSPHPAGRRQGDVDERYSAAVGRDGTGLGSHRSVGWVGVARRADPPRFSRVKTTTTFWQGDVDERYSAAADRDG
jgi:hypothetical protein